jgi:hypothetical protein
MATIIKTNYLSRQHGGQRQVLNSLYYYAHRRDRDGELVSRTGFSRDRDDLTAGAMKDVIEGSDGAYYYRMVLSPGTAHDSDLNLKDWTRDLVLELEGKHGKFPYVAVEHRDQTDYAHVHVVMVLDRKLDRAELDQLRDTGTKIYDLRREWYEPSQEQTKDIDRHLAREPITYNEAFIAGYSDEPDERIRHLRRDKGQSLDK